MVVVWVVGWERRSEIRERREVVVGSGSGWKEGEREVSSCYEIRNDERQAKVDTYETEETS